MSTEYTEQQRSYDQIVAQLAAERKEREQAEVDAALRGKCVVTGHAEDGESA